MDGCVALESNHPLFHHVHQCTDLKPHTKKARKLAIQVNYAFHVHFLAQLRNVFAGTESVWQYGRRRGRGNRKLVTHVDRNARSYAQSSGAALGHFGTRRRTTTNG